MTTTRRYRPVLPFLLSLFLLSCSRDFAPMIPEFGPEESMITNAKPLSEEQGNLLEGIYEITTPDSRFGNLLVLKWHHGTPSLFGKENGAFFIMEGGEVDGQIIFEGYWRYSSSLETGRTRFILTEGNGAGDILIRGERPAGLQLNGEVSEDDDDPLTEALTLRYRQPLPADTATTFRVIGHRGGGRNSDFHPYSENSLEMIRFSERLGCNAVEIDVQLTSDGIPILYHDENFNSRLVQGEHLVGAVTNYSYAQISRFARLVNGEKIPTLQEALETIRKETTLELVWLDVKTPETIGAILPIVENETAAAAGRTPPLEIIVGLPQEPVFNAFLQIPEEERPPAICELDPDFVRRVGAIIWAPRWTEGLQTPELQQMHAEGRRAFAWTIDQEFAIRDFIEGGYDGILSNRPSLVAWHYYTGRP